MERQNSGDSSTLIQKGFRVVVVVVSGGGGGGGREWGDKADNDKQTG